MVNQKLKNRPVWAWSSGIIGNILEFNMRLDEQINNKANFVMGASAIILIFSIGILSGEGFLARPILDKIGWLVIVFGVFLSFIMSIIVITPKVRLFSKKERLKEDMFYYKNIVKFWTREEYIGALHSLKSDGDKIDRAFGNQIYSLSKNILPHKSKFLKCAGWILVGSLITGIILIFVNLFLG